MQGRRTNWSSLFFGLVFLGVAALLLSGQVGVVTSLRWAGPILLIVIALCLIGWAVAERPRPAPSTPQVAPPSPWGAGAGIPGTAAASWGVASGPGASAPVPAQEPGGGAEPDDPGDASAPGDPPSPAG
jgi:hypothetical protein